MIKGKKKSSKGRPRSNKKKKTIEDIIFEIQKAENIYLGEKNQIHVKVSPEKYIKLVEATITDPLLRQMIIKPKKISKGNFELRFKPKETGKYSISFYARTKQKKFKREEIGVNSIIREKTVETSTSSMAAETYNIDFSKIKKRTWPSSSAYSIALQNPKQNIAESYEIIRNGTFEKNPMVKYPTLIFGSGNFGTVFKVKTDGGIYAIKCFTRGSPDLEIRYMAISSFLKAKKLPFFTEFNYMDNAVRVMGKKETYFPILMMSWVTGENMNQYIKRNLNNPNALTVTAKSLLKSVQEMVKSNIAHGDLSGDNILVRENGEINLIDYDGMYVPAISSLGASEAGHEAFQHPKRMTEFNERLDYFSCLLIYVTLLALSKKPELWQFNEGDGDKLIISGDDLNDPSHSQVLKEMLKIGGKVKTLTNLLIKSLSKDSGWEQISPLLIS